jgi:hypothetical protein
MKTTKAKVSNLAINFFSFISISIFFRYPHHQMLSRSLARQ